MYLGIIIAVPLLAILVQRNTLAGVMLSVFGALAFGWITYQAFQRDRIARQRLFVVLILMFFSMLFWACFEQAGSSVNNFTDRNVDRVVNDSPVQRKAGETITFELTQEQVGYTLNIDHSKLYELLWPSLTDLPSKKLLAHSKAELTGLNIDDKTLDDKTAEALGMKKLELLAMNSDKQVLAIYQKVTGSPMPTSLEELKTKAAEELQIAPERLAGIELDDLQRLLAHVPVGMTKERLKELSVEQLQAHAKSLLREKGNHHIEWELEEEHAGMSTGGAEIPASIFQSVNPIFIILFAPLFSALWEKLAAIGREPSTPVKFALGVTQLGIGFGCLWKGAASADDRGMVFLLWLLLGYMFQTTGELCLSPVGLSMITKLSPADIVSTVMGAWFMATAFSNYLAGMIAKLTGVSEGEGGGNSIPAPIHTVDVYGEVFLKISVTAIVVGVLCLAISPILKRWMHEDHSA